MTAPGTAQPAAAPPVQKPEWLRAAIPLDQPDGQAAIALAVELREAGVFTGREVNGIIAQGTSALAHGPAGRAHQALDYLRIAAQVAPRFPDRGRFWYIDLAMVVSRTHERGRRPVPSPDQLDSVAAVVAFVLWVDAEEQQDSIDSSQLNNLKLVPDCPLDTLLRQRPHDLDRIIAFARERGIHSDEAVEHLREWLDGEGATAVADGWL